MPKNLWLWVAVVIVVVGGLWLVFSKPKPASGETIKIGAALGLTDFCATWGEDEQKAIRMAVDEANAKGGIEGRQIELSIEDMRCDAKGVVNAVKKLIDVDEVEAIVGPTWGDSFQGGFITANQNKVVAVSGSAALEALIYNKTPLTYSFSTWFPEKIGTNTLQTYLQKIGKKKVFVLHDQDPYGLMIIDLFKSGAAQHGLEVIGENSFQTGYEDFRTVITQLKALKPEVVYLNFLTPQTKGKFLVQARELGFTTQFMSTVDIQDDSLLEEFGPVLEGILYAFPKTTGAYDAFKNAFQKKYGSLPSGSSAANAYDAARVVINGLTEHYKNGVDIKTAVEQTNLPGTVVEHIQFDQNHKLTNATFNVKTVKNGQFVVVE